MCSLQSEQKRIIPTTVLSAGKCLQIIHRMLENINRNLASHCERTAYLSLLLAGKSDFQDKFSLTNLLLISVFHAIGFYRFNTFDSDFDYFSKNAKTEQSYVFARYFINYMTPVASDSVAMVYFNQDYNKKIAKLIPQIEYVSIIQLSSIVSDYYQKNKSVPKSISKISPVKLDSNYVKIFESLNSSMDFEKILASDQYKDELEKTVSEVTLEPNDTLKLLKLLIYVLDFKSTSTVTHTINTACYAYSIGSRFDLDEDEINKLFVSAILHDVGKVAIPHDILESPNKLNYTEMNIMRAHVNHTKRILENIVDDEICNIACHHHDKLNGSGYPLHLTEKDLTLSDRILTVSDIISALADSRSYKERFSKEKIIQLLKEMTENGELDSKITDLCVNQFDKIHNDCEVPRLLLISDIAKVTSKFAEYQTSLDKTTEI